MEIVLKASELVGGGVAITATYNGEERVKQYENASNRIFPLYKELMFYVKLSRGQGLNIKTNSYTFVDELKTLESSKKRLAVMLKETLATNAVTIKSVEIA